MDRKDIGSLPGLSIIIPTYFRDEIFAETLRAAETAISRLNAEIIVVNDAEDHPIETNKPRVRVMRNAGKGACAARNYGASVAIGEILIFMDNDMIISEENLVKTLELHKKAEHIATNPIWISSARVTALIKKSPFGRLSKKIGLISYQDRHLYAGFPMWKEGEIFANYALGAYYLSVERADFMKTDGFPERFKFCGMEEESFARDLSRYVTQYVDTNNVIIHNEWDKMDLRIKLRAFQNANNNLYTYCQDNGKPDPYNDISSQKQTAYRYIYRHKDFFLKLADIMPNSRMTDSLYNFVARMLIGAYSYKGYLEGLPYLEASK